MYCDIAVNRFQILTCLSLSGLLPNASTLSTIKTSNIVMFQNALDQSLKYWIHYAFRQIERGLHAKSNYTTVNAWNLPLQVRVQRFHDLPLVMATMEQNFEACLWGSCFYLKRNMLVEYTLNSVAMNGQ